MRRSPIRTARQSRRDQRAGLSSVSIGEAKASNGPSLAMSAIWAVSEDHPSGRGDAPYANTVWAEDWPGIYARPDVNV